MRKLFFFAFLLISLSSSVNTRLAEAWKIKSDESYVNFSARSAFTRVHGKIPGIQGEIKFSEEDLAGSKFNASLEPASLNTENGKRDRHLKSADFLDVEKFPKIKFVSKKIEKTGNGYSVTGDLTVKDVTKEISFPFTFENQGNRGIFKGSFAINRQKYHVGGSTKLAGDNINIDITTVAEKVPTAEN
ncbi:MAG: YceI family protein [Cytophagaceae bacterium]|nr:YceI family protein [Cytophagaceae bacterium]